MRIIVNGQQAFGQAVLDGLIDKGHEVVGVYCRPDPTGRPADPLRLSAEEKGLAVFQPSSFHDPDVREQMRSLAPDLGVMAYVTLHVPENVLAVPRNGTIQFHPSQLPRHRGPSSINWPIIGGEATTGLSIFWPDDGLDEGPILLQREVEISDDDTLGTLYFGRLFPMGVQAMLDAVDLVAEGKAPRLAQDPALATYEGWCRHEDAQIDWTASSQVVWNLIRGTNPQPGAWTTVGGRTLKIYDSIRQPVGVGARAGTVVEVADDGVVVATSDGQIKVRRVRLEGSREKVGATDIGLAVGDELG
jgi:methionyl-tRNA formyltransferase